MRASVIHIIATSDLHGVFFPFDFIENKPEAGSMAYISGFIRKIRDENSDSVVLLDNGDILQGQPACYYYNNIAIRQPNIASSVINYLGYDAVTIGNHDLEAGPEVYGKWQKELNCPIIAANIQNTSTDTPYFSPYKIIYREGCKIAILGLTTDTIPLTMGPEQYPRMSFCDIYDSAKFWSGYINATEAPDILIGLFHCGWNSGMVANGYRERSVSEIVKNIPGFDLVIYGHDHVSATRKIRNLEGKDVLCLNPSANGKYAAHATIAITKTKEGLILDKSVSGMIVDVAKESADADYIAHLGHAFKAIRDFTDCPIGTITETVNSAESFSGSSPFMDILHRVLRAVTNADIAFCAPTLPDTTISKGIIRQYDIFKLYRFNNKITVLTLTGREIKNYLEYSYSLWINTISSPDEHILNIGQDHVDPGKYHFNNPYFDFDSASGIEYDVDVTRNKGERIMIKRLSDGHDFEYDKKYLVATNSYRAHGGGSLIIEGAGLGIHEIAERIVYESEHDIKFYIKEYIEQAGTIRPQAGGNWKFVPEAIADAALLNDKHLLFD